MEVGSLKSLCARRICFSSEFHRLIKLLPEKLRQQLQSLYESIEQAKKSYEAFRNAPEYCFVVMELVMQLDRILSAKAVGRYLNKPQYFTLCAALGMDEETARIFASMNIEEKQELGDENAVVNVRVGELSRIPPIPFYYETAALVAARNGWLEAFHKYLTKVEQDDMERVTARCVLKAIVHQQYHIANSTPIRTFGDEFYSEFPDGRVPIGFFTSLFTPGLLRPELGRQIARELIRWLPVLDVTMLRHRLDGEKLTPEIFLECANMLDERRLGDMNSYELRFV